ncbi:DNA mismatch repair protein MutS [Oceanibium sediminis]|uniref:DNA mismatch repair protein MutS n=1 Tax=Oceanibium sediminis TaxID=2026339 RepID=UPI000DD463C0|nr:DNA mismatch repair protein MutS [Oceanibium sediminis]
MMAQYLEIKARYPDALLFYRMGDFYELFFDDAVAAAGALDIALTKRGKHQGEDIAMCGVPHHAAEGYLLTLIRKGFRVAIGEQLESPAEAKKRGGHKAVVNRDVVRLVTPGTLTEDSLLSARANNFLAAFSEVRDEAAFAWVDVSTGELTVTEASALSLSPLLARTAPRELLVSENTGLPDTLAEDMGITLTRRPSGAFDSKSARHRIAEAYGVDGPDAFGTFTRAQLGAIGALLDYLDLTQRGRMPLLRPPHVERAGGTMQIDAATRANLELTRALSGGRDGSLLAAIDRTVTGPGARLLESRLTSPSTDISVINNRLASLSAFVEDSALRADVRTALRKAPDIERAMSRLGLGRGGPRDLAAVRNGLEQAETLGARLARDPLPGELSEAHARLSGHDALIDLLGQALVAEPPLLTRDGGLVATGYHEELDETRRLRDEGRGVIAGMQADYVKTTGINALKIKHNNVLGYFIETPASHAAKMMAAPLSDTFIHRQTTANQVRFTTVELSELETRILNAGGRALDLEQAIFAELCKAVLARAAQISETARALAMLDHTAALAELAAAEDWSRPRITDSRDFAITGGRHPVVEQALRRSGGGSFVANDCTLSADGDEARPVWLLTGPNMAGKSTFLRQNALIALLAQTGSFVPADAADIGIVDQLFSRVGAADDLARGRSTFMVEMVETAAILNQAGPRSLVILDEIGRGTATYDGLSIAWATLEHLHDANRCRALFATHYHELTALSETLKGLRNATVAVREWEGEVIFLHEVREGAADRSYGVQVAKLAGLPDAVVARARDVLAALEEGDRGQGGKAKALIDDLPLFSTTPPPMSTPATPEAPLRDRLAEVWPDELTPKEALALVYDLKSLSEKG